MNAPYKISDRTFDRMLIAQAPVEDMTLVSADSTFNQYEVSLLWAASS